MTEYNQWYWKLYRWCKWDAKHFHRTVWRGIKNLWVWFPIVWKDRDWDHNYIFNMLKFKLERVANRIEKTNYFEGSAREAEYVKTCIRLITKIQDDFYLYEYQDYVVSKMFTTDLGDGTVSLDFEVLENNIEDFFKKYPLTKKQVMNNKKFSSNLDKDNTVGLYMGVTRHNKAKKLLFKILEERVEHWWD